MVTSSVQALTENSIIAPRRVALIALLMAAACSDPASNDVAQQAEGTGGSSTGGTAADVADGGQSASASDAGSSTGGSQSSGDGTGGAEGGQDTSEQGPLARPSRLMPLVPLALLEDGRGVYNPHRGGEARFQGSGHTHAAPDHSAMDPAKQEQRLRDLPGALAHDFVWLTSHLFVAPDPGVSGITHLFGIENYTKTLPSGGAPHVLALLPDGELAGKTEPFGRYTHTLIEMPAHIEAAGGLAVLAHPSRYSPSIAEAVSVGDSLWGVGVVSGGTSVAENLKYLDARLKAGKYTCASAGNDLHAANYGLTTGYQMVSAASAERADLVRAVQACDFFACRTDDEKATPIGAPAVRVEAGVIHASMQQAGTLRFVANGEVRKTVSGAQGEYVPGAGDDYVRVEMSLPSGGAQCLSQPLWLMEPPSSGADD